MKILLWPAYYVPSIGGLEIMTHTLAKQLQKEGHEILVISTNSSSDELKEMVIDGIRIFLYPLVIALSQHQLRLIKKIFTHLNQTLDDFAPDLVHVHGWFENFCFYQVRVLEKRGVPLCISIHGLLEQKYYHTPYCSKLWARAQAITAVSERVLRELKQYGIEHPALNLIYNGLPIPKTNPGDLDAKPPFRLIMIGRLIEEKGFDLAFYALKDLVSKYPNLKLTVVGGGSLFQELSHLKHVLALDQHIEMTDFVHPDHVSTYIDQASIVLIPSHYESCPLVALETAMRGRPAIAADIPGLNEIVLHHQTGLLFEAKNKDALAEAIDYLLSQPEKIKQLGGAAQERTMRLFSIENTTEQYLNIYQNIAHPFVEAQT